MPDYYLESPEQLKGQPKATIADYVEQNGILVPKRFDSLKEARDSGLPIIVRSEHPQEYNGISGLLNSEGLERFPDISDEKELKAKILKLADSRIKHYCTFLDLDEQRFRGEVSFSYWKKLEGYNRTIIADSAIDGRYHITTDASKGQALYTLLENGRILVTNRIPYGTYLDTEFAEGLDKLVGLYESVRSLGRFDPNHCPLMEVQTVNGKNYFLQYHRTRDFEPSHFSLNANPNNEGIKALFVRGATSPEGITCKATLIYAFQASNMGFTNIRLPEKEDASFDDHDFDVFSALMVSKRKVQLIPTDSLDELLWEVATQHFQRSRLFNPEVSVVVAEDKIFLDDEFKSKYLNAYSNAEETGEDQHIDLHIVSDGREAFIKRV